MVHFFPKTLHRVCSVPKSLLLSLGLERPACEITSGVFHEGHGGGTGAKGPRQRPGKGKPRDVKHRCTGKRKDRIGTTKIPVAEGPSGMNTRFGEFAFFFRLRVEIPEQNHAAFLGHETESILFWFSQMVQMDLPVVSHFFLWFFWGTNQPFINVARARQTSRVELHAT